MNALSRKPRSMAEMLIEVSDQRNELAVALNNLISAADKGGFDDEALKEVWRMCERGRIALSKVPSTVLLARKPE